MAKIYMYKGARASEGARNLQAALGATMMRSEGSVYRGRPNSVVINWGARNAEARRIQGLAPVFLNKVDAVVSVADKARFFEKMKEDLADLCIPFCTTYDAALELVIQGGRVFARTVLNGHSGEGIQLMVTAREGDIRAIRKVRENNLMPVNIIEEDNPDQALRDCQLFTQGIIGRRTEFRIHVVGGKTILSQVKLRREGHADNPLSNTIVRNVASGWVYGVQNIEEQAGLGKAQEAALRTVNTFGLDFGAVDVIYKHDTDQVFVLEVNTAPGLADEGSALEKYTEAFKEMF